MIKQTMYNKLRTPLCKISLTLWTQSVRKENKNRFKISSIDNE